MSGKLHIGILAAGRSSRMRGRDKLMEDIDGIPLLRHVTGLATAALPDAVTYVVLPKDNAERLKAIEGTNAQSVPVGSETVGMGVSIAAMASKSLGHPLLVILADMPDVRKRDLEKLVAVFCKEGSDKIIRAADTAGRAGHPIIFPARLIPELCELTDDKGGRMIVERDGATLVEVPGATTDLDTPEDWVNWRRARNRS